MQELFSEVTVHRVSDKIVSQLVALISDGKLAPGDKLPPERELIAQLGVGRSSLREALSILEALGYVEVRSRKGVFVRGLDPGLALAPLSRILREDFGKLHMLYEVRNDIELASAAAAARRRTPADLEAVGRCLETLERARERGEPLWEYDQAFHVAVAQASHNFIRVHMVNHMFEFTRPLLERWMTRLLSDPASFASLHAQHRAVHEAIAAADPAAARARMAEHFAWSDAKIDADHRLHPTPPAAGD
jgi:GntR family transcriptional repressor for pyruvate dehydrogenase complex